ncbi:hypothetical protein [Symmachiella dynata]|uniref:hypothetical protein n=1 Tax=Symmachiella dynata TaxID=2527995 RepID=UPI0030EF1F36
MPAKHYGMGLVVLLAVFVITSNTAEAQKLKPFKVSGEGFVDFIPLTVGPTANHTSQGTATHLGAYHLSAAAVQLDSEIVFDEDGVGTADFSSAVDPVFVAANGDQLTLHYDGVVMAIPQPNGTYRTFWVADFTPVPAGNTGRFKKVTGGSFVMYAESEPFIPGVSTDVYYEWEGDGFLEWDEE